MTDDIKIPPAPWRIEQVEMSVNSHGRDFKVEVPLVEDYDGNTVCVVEAKEILDATNRYDGYLEVGFDTSLCDATARLLKEAPTMLALLKELKDDYVQNPNGIKKIDELLAKIKGDNDNE